jgi:hypothetical protein
VVRAVPFYAWTMFLAVQVGRRLKGGARIFGNGGGSAKIANLKIL